MQIKHFNIVFLCLAIITSEGCKKQLSVFPTTEAVEGSVITDLKSARIVLNGVYYRFGSGGVDYNGVPCLFWADLQEGYPSQLSGLLSFPYGSSAFSDHTYIPSTGEVNFLWTYCYGVINGANSFLKNVTTATNINPSAKMEMIAEAKFLRAYANTTLLLYFGRYDDVTSAFGNLLRTEAVEPSNSQLSRSTVSDTYSDILADLDEAIKNLPDRNTSNIYASTWAARLLKARLLINRKGQGDDAEVINLTKDVIDNGSYVLESDTKDIFLSKTLGSNEVILGLQPFKNQIYKFQDYLIYQQYTASASLINLFSDDPRSTWMYKKIPDPFGLTDSLAVITKYYPGDVTNPASNSVTEYSYAMRLKEAYLLQAEATVTSGGDINTAKELLKTVLTSAGISDFSNVDNASSRDSLLVIIIEEEMKNFVAEGGQDWFAVRRLPFETLQTLIPSITDKKQFILPIPLNEMTRNPKIMQNPGY